MSAAASAESSQQVAEHYNAVPEKGLAERTKSRIFYLRNLNNWVKSMLIGEILSRIRREKQSSDVKVLDMCCGKGGDLLKWRKGDIKHLVCVDIADVSLEQCKSRYQENSTRAMAERRPHPMFTAEFISADCTRVRFKENFSDPDLKLDLCSCQFSLHYGFESEQQAKCILRNACESLGKGGYFIGTLPDANILVGEFGRRRSEDGTFENDVCKVSFDNKAIFTQGVQPALFGERYHFSLDEVVNCPEYLVHFPLLEHLLSELGMELVYKKSFAQVIEENAETRDGKQLLARMQAMEPFPPDEDVELMGGNNLYEEAKTKHNQLRNQYKDDRKMHKVGTLSKSEWEVACIYLVFAFRKKSD